MFDLPGIQDRFMTIRRVCTLVFWQSLLAAVICVAGLGNAGAEEGQRAGDRQELLALMAEVEAGINAQSVDRLTALMTDDVSVTWLNAEVSRGKGEVGAYYRRMVGGPGAVLKSYRTKVALAAPARFYGETAVADGRADDEFVPHERGIFRLDSRWSATLRKLDGQWRIAALHLSSNVFTNPLLVEAERMVWTAGAGGVVAGMLAVLVSCRLRRRYSHGRR